MCQFFSLISDGQGVAYYFNAKQRKQIRKNTLVDKQGHYNLEADSHTSIAAYFGLDEDYYNKYEYNPLTKRFVIDSICAPLNDQNQIKALCAKLDFSKIVPELIIKPIVHPWRIRQRKKVVNKDTRLLRVWASVEASVRDSVRDLVGASVWDSVWDSVWASVWASVGDSAWDSARAYTSSFFKIKKYKGIKHKAGQNPFQSGIDLWHRGLVPSFDGRVWRLHGPEGKILKEITKEDLQNIAL